LKSLLFCLEPIAQRFELLRAELVLDQWEHLTFFFLDVMTCVFDENLQFRFTRIGGRCAADLI